MPTSSLRWSPLADIEVLVNAGKEGGFLWCLQGGRWEPRLEPSEREGHLAVIAEILEGHGSATSKVRLGINKPLPGNLEIAAKHIVDAPDHEVALLALFLMRFKEAQDDDFLPYTPAVIVTKERGRVWHTTTCGHVHHVDASAPNVYVKLREWRRGMRPCNVILRRLRMPSRGYEARDVMLTRMGLTEQDVR